MTMSEDGDEEGLSRISGAESPALWLLTLHEFC